MFNEKIKVCLITPVPPPMGGIANWTNIITNYQQDEVEFITINTNHKKHGAKGRNIFDRIVVSGFEMLKTLRQLKKILKNQKIDCVHLNTSGSLGLIRDKKIIKLCQKFNVRISYHLHFGRTPEVLQSNSFEKKMLLKNLKKVNSIITMDKMTEEAIKKIDLKNVFYIPNPINNIEGKSNLKAKKVMYMGWMVKTKGVEELIEAWNTLVEQDNFDWTLELIGPGNDKYIEELKKKSHSSIHFVGELEHDEAMKKMEECSIFILPSYTEGFPNVILEAMIHKMAIIATKVGAIPQMIDNSGILIEKENIEEIINAIKVLRDYDYRCSLAEKAYSKVVNEYLVENVFLNIKKIWK